VTEETRTPGNPALVDNEIPADGAAPVVDETPGDPNPTASTEGQADAPESPSPGVQDSTVEKRFRDTQAALMQAKQELANLKRQLTPDVVAAIQTTQQPNVSGRELLRKKLESNPEIMDDPITNLQYHQNMNAAQIQAMLDERDAKHAFAKEADDIPALKNVNLRDPKMEIAYRNARAVLINSGEPDTNPYMLAFTFAYPQEAKRLMKGGVSVDDASRRAAQRIEKPGPAREPQAGNKPVVVDKNDPNWFIAYVQKNHPGVASQQ
jgi:hypothetical protein